MVRVRILGNYQASTVLIHANDKSKDLVITLESLLPQSFTSQINYSVELPEHQVRREYKGYLHIDKTQDRLIIINEVPLEDYVASVVLSEIGWVSEAAMLAQAVLARTRVVKVMNLDADYDVGDLTDDQVYKGLSIYSEKAATRLKQTHGQILAYQGMPIEAVYHSTCAERVYSAQEIWGGKETPYLIALKLPKETPEVNQQNWLRVIDKSKVDSVFQSDFELNMPLNYKLASNGQAIGVYINSRWYGIDSFRLRVNRSLGWNQLRSNYFSLALDNHSLVFRGKGFGHLVGLCQKQAIALSKLGWSYQALLEYFYPNTSLLALGEAED